MTEYRIDYTVLRDQKNGEQKKIDIESALEVFFGYNHDGLLRLSFLSKNNPISLESTKIIKVVQGKEDRSSYWTSFDLLDDGLKEAYVSFCENMIDSVIGVREEQDALKQLQRRFRTWKHLFQKNTSKDLSQERLMGLYGELVTLRSVVAPRVGIDVAVQSWGGPYKQSKDFSLSNSWFEVKTIGTSAESVKISSLTQLSSEVDGHLVVIRVETMSEEYRGRDSSVIDVIRSILNMISDERTERLLIEKVYASGIDLYGQESKARFDIKSVGLYLVNDEFPRITDQMIKAPEITNVGYTISIAGIARFAEEQIYGCP